MSKENNIATVKETLPIEYQNQSQYLDPTQLTIPRYRINHDSGKLENNLTGEEVEELECILLDMRQSRIKWDPTMEIEEPLCRSRNTVKSEDGKDCQGCSDRLWHGKEKPACSEEYNFAGLDTNGIPFLFVCTRTAIGPARKYISAFQLAKRPLFSAQTVIMLRQEKKGTSNYFIPVFKKIRDLEGPEIAEYAKATQELKTILNAEPLEKSKEEI